MFFIFLHYFSTLITNLKSFFYLIQIFIPHFRSPTTLVHGPGRMFNVSTPVDGWWTGRAER